MTIFRRRSRSEQILEASASPSAYFLADFDNKENVHILKDDNDNDPVKETDDISSTWSLSSRSNSSNSSSSSKKEEEALEAYARTLEELEEEGEEDLLQDYSVNMDPQDDSQVRLSMECPGILADDLNVQVENGILTIEATKDDNTDDGADADAAPTTSTGSSPHRPSQHQRRVSFEQSFQLDEQSLDIHQLTANLDQGVLNITVPKKEDSQVTLREFLPILKTKPPRIDDCSFHLIMDLPGVHAEDIYVCYANGKLRVSANRHFGMVRSFKRTFAIDTQTYNADLLSTYLYRGQLTIVVPPKAERFTRTIQIAEGTTAAPRTPNNSERSNMESIGEDEEDRDD